MFLQFCTYTFRICRKVGRPAASGGSGVYILGASGVAIIAAGGTDLYCHSKPPLTSGKLCFIINFIGGYRGAEFLLGGCAPTLFPSL